MQLFYVITVYFYQRKHTTLAYARPVVETVIGDVSAAMVLTALQLLWDVGENLLENPVKITPTRWATRAARGRARKGFNALDASGLHDAVDAARVNAHADQWARKWHVCAKCSS